MRTTSSLEAFNLQLNKSIGKKPIFFKFVDRLKIHESRKAQDGSTEVAWKMKHKKDQERDEKIKLNTDLLRTGKSSIAEFLNTMAATNSTFFKVYQHVSN